MTSANRHLGEFFNYATGRMNTGAEEVAERNNMSIQQARMAIGLPVTWLIHLEQGFDHLDVLAEIEEQIAYYETNFGESHDWDDLRVVAMRIFVRVRNFNYAASVLAGVKDVGHSLECYLDVLHKEVVSGQLTMSDLMTLSAAVRKSFLDAGKGQVYMSEGRDILAGAVPEGLLHIYDASGEMVELSQGDSIQEWVEIHEPYTPRAFWNEIAEIVEGDDNWPVETHRIARQKVGYIFARSQDKIFSQSKPQRKDVEALKEEIALAESETPCLAMDYFRFVAALSLYDRGAPNFGRGMARAMTDPEMMAMVCHALIERGRDRDATDVWEDIPDYVLQGRMLAAGEWQDQAAIAALIQDITYATVKNSRRYEPARRIGIADGLCEQYSYNAQQAQAINDAPAAAKWQEQAGTMAKRAALLRQQELAGFIKARVKK